MGTIPRIAAEGGDDEARAAGRTVVPRVHGRHGHDGTLDCVCIDVYNLW
jgi:hypothetical protein